MASVRKDLHPLRLPGAVRPIRYLTENGFSIIRLCEVDSTVQSTPRDCRFLVARDNEPQRVVRVEFDHTLIDDLQIRRRLPLAPTSPFWVVSAENSLATYLWEKNEYPPDGQLKIYELSPDELMLALHWRDHE